MSSISLKRLNKEYENLTKDPPENFVAFPIKDDMFCWHFTVRGPDDSDFEGGIFHGIIKLPTAYPHKPPNIMFLTTNGRYDTKMNICLSMTKYHKEEWQAAWTIRSMLEAIIAFMPIKEDHEAIGALDTSSELRKRYATLSAHYVCDVCGPIANLLSPKPKVNKVVKEDDEQAHSTSSKSKKKVDQHPRIKGVIVEDSHEDDLEEENKLRKGNTVNSNQKEKEAKIQPIEEEESTIFNNNSNNNNTKSEVKENNKETVNFIEFFKKMRMNQYQKDNCDNNNIVNNDNTTNINTKPIVDLNEKGKTKIEEEDSDIEIITTNKKETKQADNTKTDNNVKRQEQVEPISISNKDNNQVNEKTQYLFDELEFQHLMGTIKLHQSKSNEEIVTLLQKDIMEQKRKPKEKIKNAMYLCTENLKSNQKELEKLLKSQVKNMKTYTKLLYEEGLKKRLRIINCILTVSIILIFTYFWVIRPRL